MINVEDPKASKELVDLECAIADRNGVVDHQREIRALDLSSCTLFTAVGAIEHRPLSCRWVPLLTTRKRRNGSLL